MANQNKDFVTDFSVINNFIEKIGEVLARTKDTLVKDFLDNIEQYIPNIPDDVNYTYEQFKADLKSGETPLTKFINAIFYKIGYDLSSFQENKELADLLKAIVSSTLKLGEAIKELSDDKEELIPHIKEFISNAEEDKISDYKKAVSDLFGADFNKELGWNFGNKEVQGSVSLVSNEYLDKIIAIYNLLKEIFSLVKSFRDIEINKIIEEDKDFCEFVKDTFFTKQFAERIVDYILVVMLKNAKDVFADDINIIMDNINKMKSEIRKALKEKEKEIKDKIGQGVEEILDRLNELHSIIKGLKQQLQNAVDEAKTHILTELRIAQEEFDKLASTLFNEYNILGKIFTRFYAILDFLNVVKAVSINVAKYIPNVPAIPEIPDIDINEKIKKYEKAALSQANKSIADANKEIADIVKDIKMQAPIVQLYVIDWVSLGNFFSKPGEYLKTIYPINDIDDAEKVIVKVLGVARAFDSRIPNLNSIKEILYDLLIRVKNRLADELHPLANDIKDVFAKLEAFILDLLNVLEGLAIAMKKELTVAYEDFNKGKDSIIKTLQKNLGQVANEVSDSVELFIKEAQHLSDNIGWNDFMRNKLVQPFIDVLIEKAIQNELFENVKPEDWKKAVEDSVNNNYDKNILAGYSVVFKEIEQYISSQTKNWDSKFNNLVKDLEKEFTKQTKKVPDNYDELEKYAKTSINNIIQGTIPDNPFSEFDFMAYFDVISKDVVALIPESPEIYFIKLRNITEASVNMLFNTGGAIYNSLEDRFDSLSSQERQAKIRTFVCEVYAAYWDILYSYIKKYLFKPILQKFEICVKDWAVKEVLPCLFDAIKNEVFKYVDYSRYIDVFELPTKQTKLRQKSISESVLDIVKEMLLLVDDVKDIDSWKDGFHFAIKLYKIIPKEVKNYLRELIDIPNIDVSLPDYTFNMKNKMFAVTLFDYPGENDIDAWTSDNYRIETKCSIKFLLVAGNRKGKDENIDYGLYFMPLISGDFGGEFNLGKKHTLQLAASTTLNSEADTISKNIINKNEKTDEVNTLYDTLSTNSLGFFFYQKADDAYPSVDMLCSSSSVSAYFEMLFLRGQVGIKQVDAISVFKTKYADMTIGNYPQKLFLGYNNGFDIGYIAGIRDVKLTIRLRELCDLLTYIFKDDIEVTIQKLDLGYTYKDGLKFDGNYNLRLPLKPEIELKGVKFSNLAIDLGTRNFNNWDFDFITTFTIDTKCFTISLPDIGIGMSLSKGKSWSDFNLSPNIRFPNGLGIGLDIGGVNGAGLIKWDVDKGEYVGALELDVFGLFGANAMLVIATKTPDGNKGFSIMALVSASFKPGIALGMGFSLSGVGGALGIDRSLAETQKLTNSVRDGSLIALMFATDLKRNFDEVSENICSFYPAKKDAAFVGFLAKISWMELFKMDAGLFIEFSNKPTFIIAGVMKLAVADSSKALEKLLSINVAFLTHFNPLEGLFLGASLYDSKIMGIDLQGDIVFSIRWGSRPRGFIFSAGGFHPEYTPPTGFYVDDLKRISMKLDYKVLRVSLETYLAVTSNTVQFGAAARLKVGWDKFGLFGEFYFNTLFQFKPFKFIFDVGVSVAVKIGNLTLFSISLALGLEGPAMWRAKGNASFRLLLIKFNVDFNYSWGKSQSDSDKLYIEIVPLLLNNYRDKRNWEISSTDLSNNLVSLKDLKTESLLINPSDIVSFKQNEVPLFEHMEKFGDAVPGDTSFIDIEKVKIGGYEVEISTLKSDFAPTMIRNLSEKEKLKEESYREMASGFYFKDSTFEQQTGDCENVQINKIEYICSQEINIKEWEAFLEIQAKGSTKSNVVANKNSSVPKMALLMDAKLSRLSSQRKVVKQGGKPHKGTAVKPNRLVINQLKEVNPMTKAVVNVKHSRPSYRRSDEGFKRYVKELDNQIYDNMDKISFII